MSTKTKQLLSSISTNSSHGVDDGSIKLLLTKANGLIAILII